MYLYHRQRRRRLETGAVNGTERDDRPTETERPLSRQVDHTCLFAEGPFVYKCTTSCREYPEEKSAASAKALAPRKAPAEQSPPPREEQSAKERQERKKKVFPKKLAICAGGYLLRLMSIHRARTLGSQETKQPDEQNISLVEFKPMDGKRPVEESAEETSADHDDHEEEEEEEVSLSGEAEATEVGKDDRIEGFESSPEFSPVRSSTVLKEIETILETERKSKEDVLAFTMEQSVLRAREKTEMRAALDQKDREIQRKDEILHMVLGSISQSLGIASFPDDEAGGGSPESAWRVKEEAILRKIKDLSTERSNKALGATYSDFVSQWHHDIGEMKRHYEGEIEQVKVEYERRIARLEEERERSQEQLTDFLEDLGGMIPLDDSSGLENDLSFASIRRKLFTPVSRRYDATLYS